MSQRLPITGDETRPAYENLASVLRRGEASGVSFDWTTGCPALWKPDTGIPVVDSIRRNPANDAYAAVCMSPVDFLRLQMASKEAFTGDPATVEWLREPFQRAENTAELASLIEAGDTDIPHLFVVLDSSGDVTDFQEGRNRAVAAYYAGVESMPVYVVLDWSAKTGIRFARPASARRIEQYLDRREDDIMEVA